MIIRILCIGVAAGMVPLLTGMLYTAANEKRENGILKNWTSGFVTCFALFQIVSIPCIFLGRSLTELSFLYGGLLVAGCILSLWLNRSRMRDMFGDFLQTLRHTPWAVILALLVIAFQIYMYTAYMHADDDDSFYVATATTAVSTDSLFQFNPYSGAAYQSFPSRYVLSPFPMFVAMISRLSGVHTLIVAHTVLPVILLPLSYAVFALIGYTLFDKNREKTAYFILFVAVIQMFAFTTTHTQGTVLLLRIWQGKAILASILLPFGFYMGMRLILHKFDRADWLLVTALMLSCCMVSSMGIMLGAILTGIFGLLAAFLKRSIRIPVQLLLCCVPNLLFSGIYLLIR